MNGNGTICKTRPMEMSEEEAFALLELCLHADIPIDPAKARVMHKVADTCRDFIRAQRSYGRFSENDPDSHQLLERMHQKHGICS